VYTNFLSEIDPLWQGARILTGSAGVGLALVKILSETGLPYAVFVSDEGDLSSNSFCGKFQVTTTSSPGTFYYWFILFEDSREQNSTHISKSTALEPSLIHND